MNILITGALGFIGRHLQGVLLRQKHRLVVYDLHTPLSWTGEGDGIRMVTGDLAQGTGLEDIPWPSIDVVYHLAAVGVKASQRRWMPCIRGNILGTQRLLSAIDRAQVNPLVVYPRTFYEYALDEKTSLQENPYVVTKSAATQLVTSWGEANSSRRVVQATVFQVYGPGDSEGVLSYALRCFRAGQPARFGSGRGKRDWIHVDDVVSAFAACLHLDPVGVEHYDLGTGVLTSLRETVQRLAGTLGCRTELAEFDPALDRDDTDLAIAAQRRLPGWSPVWTLDAGLERFIAEEMP